MLSILIVNWNTRDLLRACLFSLRDALGELEHEIIVVDNDSNDDSAAMVATDFPEVRLAASATNNGFARGYNMEYELSSGVWVWLFHHDTEVEPGAAETLIEFLQTHERCGGVASALIDAIDGKPQRSCRTFPTPAALWAEASGLARAFPRSKRFGFYKMGWWSYADARQVDQPMASSFLMRRAAIDSITIAAPGGAEPLFDERFPIFFNDVDLCWRLRQSGWEIWYLPASRVKHWGGASTRQVKPEMIAESHRSLAAFYRKHWHGRLCTLLYIATLLLMTVSGAWRYRRALKRQASQVGSPIQSDFVS
jgi:GT2 family glycosyltransferase